VWNSTIQHISATPPPPIKGELKITRFDCLRAAESRELTLHRSSSRIHAEFFESLVNRDKHHEVGNLSGRELLVA
jgi:hypothetical protein